MAQLQSPTLRAKRLDGHSLQLCKPSRKKQAKGIKARYPPGFFQSNINSRYALLKQEPPSFRNSQMDCTFFPPFESASSTRAPFHPVPGERKVEGRKPISASELSERSNSMRVERLENPLRPLQKFLLVQNDFLSLELEGGRCQVQDKNSLVLPSLRRSFKLDEFHSARIK